MNTVNVSGYGSIENAIANQTRSKVPEVGMGVTQLLYSDRHPYTVVGIISPRRNKFGRWKAVGDANGPTYLIGGREEYYDFTR